MGNSTDLQKFKLGIQPQTKFETLKSEYKSLVEQLKIELGTLESIRLKLALSRRQICKLLMVDPSAWTRWTRAEQDAPPHIYQALKWYMQLIEKAPDVHAPLKLEQKMDLLQRDSSFQIQKLKKDFTEYMQSLETKRETPKEPNEDPKKALELEIIRYDNKRLQEKIANLETKLTTIAMNYEQVLVNIEKQAVKSNSQRQKSKITKRKSKKRSQKKHLIKMRSKSKFRKKKKGIKKSPRKKSKIKR